MVVKDSLALLIREERGTLLVRVERRLDIQLVVLKHTESISELAFFQRLTLNFKKCRFGLGFLSEHLVMNIVQSILEPPPYAHRSYTDKRQL